MKAEIHPKLYDIVIRCVCGAEYPTVSTKSEISVDVCANCHPFYTGKHRLVDTEGRVSRFRKKYQGVENADTKPKNKK
jgi:large subunit ribosomal protein L31